MGSGDTTVTARLRVIAEGNATKVINSLTGELVAAGKAEDRLAAATKRRAAEQKQAAQAAYGLRDEWGGRHDTFGLAQPGAASGGGTAAGVPAWMRARQMEAETRRQRVLDSLRTQRFQEEADSHRAQVLESLRGQRRQEVLGSLAGQKRGEVLSSLYAQRQAELAHHERTGRYDDLASGLRAAHGEHHAAVRELAARGLNPDGSRMDFAQRGAAALAVTRAGRYFAADGGGGRFLAGAGRLGGGAAVAATAILQDVTMADKANATAFATDRQKAEMRLRGTGPFGIPGMALGGILDANRALEGNHETVGKLRESATRQVFNIGQKGVADRYADETYSRIAAAADQREALRGLKMDRPPDVDRTTAAGERQLKDAERLLPFQRELTKLAAQRSGHEKTVERAVGVEIAGKWRMLKIETERNSLIESIRKNETQDRSRWSLFGPGGAEQRRVQSEADRARLQKLDALRGSEAERLSKATDRRAEAEAGLRGNEQDTRQQNLALLREKAAVSEGRVGQAAAGAANLSNLGFGGRAMAKTGLDLIRQVGVDYTPRELIDAARAADPEGVQKAIEAAGEKYKPEFRGHALDRDSPYLADVADTRRRAKADRETADSAADADAVKRASEAVAALKVMADKLPQVFGTVIAAIEKFENDMMCHIIQHG